MRLKITITVLAIILMSLTASSQVIYKELTRFFAFSSKNLNVSKHFKDSVAMYTCNIQITIENNNNFRPVISSTDTSVSNKIYNLDTLKFYDYKSMLGKDKKVKLVLPISIIILDSKYEPKLIDAHDVFHKMAKLFYFNEEKDVKYKIIHLNPIIIMVDKKSYH